VGTGGEKSPVTRLGNMSLLQRGIGSMWPGHFTNARPHEICSPIAAVSRTIDQVFAFIPAAFSILVLPTVTDALRGKRLCDAHVEVLLPRTWVALAEWYVARIAAARQIKKNKNYQCASVSFHLCSLTLRVTCRAKNLPA